MTEKHDSNPMDDVEQLLISNTIQLDAITQLLIAKGIFTRDEYSEMLSRVQIEYQKGDD